VRGSHQRRREKRINRLCTARRWIGVVRKSRSAGAHPCSGQCTRRLVDGPFRRLDGVWSFKSLDEHACKVEFSLHYEFSSRLFEKIIGPVFSHIVGTFVDAFVKRARQVYGTANA